MIFKECIKNIKPAKIVLDFIGYLILFPLFCIIIITLIGIGNWCDKKYYDNSVTCDNLDYYNYYTDFYLHPTQYTMSHLLFIIYTRQKIIAAYQNKFIRRFVYSEMCTTQNILPSECELRRPLAAIDIYTHIINNLSYYISSYYILYNVQY